MPNVELVSREENVARIRVQLESADVDRAYKAVYRQLAKELKVPGFRPGKVPPNVIRQRVGVDTINGEVDDRLRQFAIQHALGELDVTPRGEEPRFEGDPQPKEGEAVGYEFTLAVLPEVTLPDYSGWTVDVPKVELNEELRNRYQQRMIDRFTTTEPKDGAAEAGDLISIGIHSKFGESGDDAPFGGHDIGYVPGREGNLPGFDKQLIGAKAGEEKDFDYSMPEDFADKRVAGKALKLHIHVDKVETIQAPVIDEEFVKEKLGMESLEQFNDYMEASLQREIETQLLQTKKEAAMDRVVKELQADISEDMIKDEIDGMVQENDRSLRRHGSSLDQYLQETAKSLSDYRDGLREPAINRIRFFLAAKTIADKHGFEASRDDFGRYAYYLMQREGLGPEQIQDLMKHREFFNEANYQIILEKVLGHLVESLKFTVGGEAEGTPEPAETTAAVPESEGDAG
jgi:trigger factor